MEFYVPMGFIYSLRSSPFESAPRAGLGAAFIAYTSIGGLMSFGTKTERALRGASNTITWC